MTAFTRLPHLRRARLLTWLALAGVCLLLVTGRGDAQDADRGMAADRTERSNEDNATANADDGATDPADRLAAAKARWAQMTPGEREEVLARWRRLQQMSDDDRQQALENYRRLVELQRGEDDADGIDGSDPVGPAVTEDASDATIGDGLAADIERMARDDVYRARLRQLDHDVGDLLRHDESLRRRLMEMTSDERRRYLTALRQESMRWQIRDVLAAAGVPDDQVEPLVEQLEATRREEDRLYREHVARQYERDIATIRQIEEQFGPRAALVARRLMAAAHHDHHHGRGRDHWRDGRRGPDDRDGRDGRDGRGGPDGRDWRRGPDGRGGRNWRDGRDGREGRGGRDGREGERGPGRIQLPPREAWQAAARAINLDAATTEALLRDVQALNQRLGGEDNVNPQAVRMALFQLVARHVPEDQRRRFFSALQGGGRPGTPDDNNRRRR